MNAKEAAEKIIPDHPGMASIIDIVQWESQRDAAQAIIQQAIDEARRETLLEAAHEIGQLPFHYSLGTAADHLVAMAEQEGEQR